MDRAEWYGADPGWFVPFERDAFRLFGRRLSVEYGWRVQCVANPCAVTLSCGEKLVTGIGSPHPQAEPLLRYRLDGVDIVGRTDPVPVLIEFRPRRYFETAQGRDGRDFPVVYAGEMNDSPHRYGDGSLCLYYPDDPPEQRWTHDKNLAVLIVLVQDHLFLEDAYADTGEWMAPQAEHGSPTEVKTAA